MVVLLMGALVIGALLAVQASVNPQLARAVGGPYAGSTVQLWVAVALLAVLAAATGSLAALGRLGDAPAWTLLAGLASPLYITSGILLFPRLGALAAGGLFVTGQMVASVAIDLLGLFGIAPRPVGPGIVLGAAAVLIGIVLIIRAQRVRVEIPATVPAPGGAATGPGRRARSGRTHPGWVLLGLLAGALLPVQGAVNARLRGVLGAPFAVAVVSFLVAALAITVVLLVLRATRRTAGPHLPGLRTMPSWGWLGAICAVGYVTGTFLLLPLIGAAVTVALTVAGQQLVAAAVDARGAFRLPRRPITVARAIGLILLVAGAAVVQLL